MSKSTKILNFFKRKNLNNSEVMNIIKNRLRNKMKDDFLMDSMVLYIEKEIVAKFGKESIIDDF